MPGKSFAIIVASPRARTGKTLLARLIAEHFLLQGANPQLFDTDAAERKLASYFPDRTAVVNLERVPDQMKLFDRPAAPDPDTQVIDLTHRSFQKFFQMMEEIDYPAETRALGIAPAIFYLPARDADSHEQGRLLRERFDDCSFVVVENAALGEIAREARQSQAYGALRAQPLRLSLPQIDPFFAGAIDDARLSLSDFLRQPQTRPPTSRLPFAYLSLEARAAITAWLKQSFREIGRIFDALASRAEPSSGEAARF